MITSYQENLNLAKSYIRSDALEAFKYISKAICLEPRRAEPFYILSVFCSQHKEHERARAAYAVGRELEGLHEC
jgi:hypothetical protein